MFTVYWARMGDFPALGGNRLTGKMSIVYVVLNMRIILRTMALPGKSAATYHPRMSPIARGNIKTQVSYHSTHNSYSSQPSFLTDIFREVRFHNASNWVLLHYGSFSCKLWAWSLLINNTSIMYGQSRV